MSSYTHLVGCDGAQKSQGLWVCGLGFRGWVWEEDQYPPLLQ